MESNNAIPYLKSREIEQKSLDLLQRYSKDTGKKIELPIPVLDMIEYLGYDIDFRTYDKSKDILGETYLNEKLVAINENLTEKQEGRMHFTVAHEIGHIILHAQLATPDFQILLKDQEPNILCRKEDGFDGTNNKALEWQADKFASFLLMPTAAVKETFSSIRNKPLNLKRNILIEYFSKISRRTNAINFAREIIDTGKFTNVSKLAMVNRLIGMGLIRGLRYQKNRASKKSSNK